MLLSANKILNLADKPIEKLRRDNGNRDVLFFTENAMNSHAMTIEKMDSILIDAQVNTYFEFMQTVLRLLIFTIALMVILLICSVLALLMTRNMFKDIYQSFLNITEGEFEERSSQLS